MENERIQMTVATKAAMKRFVFSSEYMISAITAIVISIMSVPLLWVILENSRRLSPELLEMFKSGGRYNLIILTLPTLEVEDLLYYDVIAEEVLSGSIVQYIVVLLVGIYTVTDIKNSYMKLSIIKGVYRYAISLQYIIVSVLGVIPIMLIYECGVIISMRIQGILIIKNMGQLISLVIIRSIMLCTIAADMCAFAMILKEYRAVIIGVFCVITLPSFPYYFQAIFGKEFWLKKICVFYLISMSGDYLVCHICEVLFAIVISFSAAVFVAIVYVNNSEI